MFRKTETDSHLSCRNILSCVSLFISSEDGEVEEEVVMHRDEVVGCILFLGMFLGTFLGTFLRSKGITPHISSPRSFCSRSEIISVTLPCHVMSCCCESSTLKVMRKRSDKSLFKNGLFKYLKKRAEKNREDSSSKSVHTRIHIHSHTHIMQTYVYNTYTHTHETSQ